VRRLGLRPLPLGFFALAVALVVASVPLSLGGEPLYDTVLYGLMALAFAVAGLLVASCYPGNAIGWLLCSAAVLSASVEVAEGYGRHVTFAAAEPAQWFASWSWVVGGGQDVLVILLFPTGLLASPRWRPVVAMLIAGVLLTAVGSGLGHAADSAFTSGANPYAVDGVGAEVVYAVGQGLFVVALLAAIASVVLRFRHSRGVERQQFKWFYPVGGLAVFGPLAAFGFYDSVLIEFGIAIVVTSIPIVLCVAILRYRLYDIDLVITRTLVYVALTLGLAGAYGLATLVLGTALGRDSAWATAGATLTATAAFRPLRRRLQDAVDRRFSRARHDALRRIGVFLDELRAGIAAPEDVEGVLRDVLCDPELELCFSVPDGEGYVDAAGRVVSERSGDLRRRTPVEHAGVRLGLVVHGAEEPRPGLALELVGAATLAIEIARLRVELRRRLAEVEASGRGSSPRATRSAAASSATSTTARSSASSASASRCATRSTSSTIRPRRARSRVRCRRSASRSRSSGGSLAACGRPTSTAAWRRRCASSPAARRCTSTSASARSATRVTSRPPLTSSSARP